MDLGFFQLEALEILWHQGPSTVKEVRARLKRALVYTTVQSTMDVLYVRGFAARNPDGRCYRYTALLSREDWYQGIVLEEIRTRSESWPLRCLEHIVEMDDEAWLDLVEREIGKRKPRRALKWSEWCGGLLT